MTKYDKGYQVHLHHGERGFGFTAYKTLTEARKVARALGKKWHRDVYIYMWAPGWEGVHRIPSGWWEEETVKYKGK
jgi:gamma-glutamylcyclotransferase (GGCT)/AIG2-like uncharacterized protein YtfP